MNWFAKIRAWWAGLFAPVPVVPVVPVEIGRFDGFKYYEQDPTPAPQVFQPLPQRSFMERLPDFLGMADAAPAPVRTVNLRPSYYEQRQRARKRQRKNGKRAELSYRRWRVQFFGYMRNRNNQFNATVTEA